MISFSFALQAASISSQYLSVSFWTSFSQFLRSSSVISLFFFIALNFSIASRRTLRTATLPSSAIFLYLLAKSSFLLSSVSWGKVMRIAYRRLWGVIPMSLAGIAFSIGLRVEASQGVITSTLASETGNSRHSVYLRGNTVVVNGHLIQHCGICSACTDWSIILFQQRLRTCPFLSLAVLITSFHWLISFRVYITVFIYLQLTCRWLPYLSFCPLQHRKYYPVCSDRIQG